jgi:MYXO-CTERM domain-containing protein
MHTLGVAMAVLGAALLLVRSPRAAKVLRPLADAGSMTLTLYSAHLVLLATGLLDDDPAALYLLMVVAALAFAVAWRRRFGQGPLERPVARAALRTRLLTAHRLAPGT